MLFLRHSRFLLIIFGLWPLKFESRFYEKLYNVYVFFIWTCYFSGIISLSFQTFFGTTAVELFAEKLSTAIVHTVTTIKFVCCVKNNLKRVLQRMEDIEQQLLNTRNKKFEEILKSQSHYCHKAEKLIWLFVFPTNFSYYGTVWMDALKGESRFVLKTWIPFESPYCKCLVDIIFSMLADHLLLAIDVAFFNCIVFCVVQLQILNHTLENLDQYALEISKDKNVSLNEAVDMAIRDCMEFHQGIFSFKDDINKIMKTPMLASFTASTVQMGMVFFTITKVEGTLKTVLFMGFAGYNFGLLCLNFWNATMLTIESEKTATSICSNKWYNFERKTLNKIIMVVMRAQKPLTVEIGSLTVVSTKALVEMVRTAYSYVVVLRSLQEK